MDEKPSLEVLMVAAQAGDRVSYRLLLAEVARLGRGFVARRIGRPEDTEDIVQEILLAIHKARHTWQPGRPFKPWFYALAGYKVNDYLRTVYRRAGHEEQPGEEDIHADPDVTFQEQTGEQLEEALSMLSERAGFLLRRTKIEGYTMQEVAAETGMSETAVKVAVHRALQQLKKIYAKQ